MKKPENSAPVRHRLFIPCEQVHGGGMFKGGAECHDGLLVYRTMVNGRLERFARECQCKIDWRNEKAMSAA